MADPPAGPEFCRPRNCDESGLMSGVLPPPLVKWRRWGDPDGCERPPPPPAGRRTFKGGLEPSVRESPGRAWDGSREGPWEDADDESDDIARYFLIQGRDKRRFEV